MHRDLRTKLLLSITSKLNKFIRVSIKRLMLLRIIIFFWFIRALSKAKEQESLSVIYYAGFCHFYQASCLKCMQAFYSQSWQYLIKLVVIATDCDSGLMTYGSSGPILLLRLLVINCEVDLHDLWEDVWEVTGLDSVGFPKRK